MTAPLLINSLAVLQAQYSSHTLLKAPFRRELPVPSSKTHRKRKQREDEDLEVDEGRQLTRSEEDGMRRHRSVAPWLYIALHLSQGKWLATQISEKEVANVPALTAVSSQLRSWASATGDGSRTEGAARAYAPPADVSELSSEAQICARLWRHTRTTETPVTLSGRCFVLPPQSAFVLAQAPDLAALDSGTYSLLVADPPWENASARRASVYACMAPHELRAMPVAPLLATRAYVAIWVTHKEPLVRFAMQSLLPAWGATYVATAHWLKVTAHGQPLSPIDPPNPRAGGAPHLPYESIVIGRKGEVSEAHAALEQRLLASRVIIADVGQRHSRKPPLDALFEPLLSALPPKADHHAYLELFARELRSGWTSWGNEVLLFNERDGNFQ